jgi:hypothetical protein
MLERYEPFWAGCNPPKRSMDRKVAVQEMKRLLELLPEKMRYFVNILNEAGVPIGGDVRGDLKSISAWFAPKVGEVEYDEATVQRMRQDLIDQGLPVEQAGLGVAHYGIDAPTWSMCHYIGFYMCERFREGNPDCRYALASGKRDIDYNQIVLVSSAKGVQFEPLRILKVFALKCLGWGGRVPEGQSLADLFGFWAPLFAGEPWVDPYE